MLYSKHFITGYFSSNVTHLPTPSPTPKLAIFLATSGHSGVDRVMKNLIPEIASRGIKVDLLHVEKHGPYLDSIPDNVEIIKLGSAHTYTSLLPLIRYLKKVRPNALLSDKDKVNRIALIAKKLANVNTRVGVRNGTTVSIDMQKRDKLGQRMHYWSMHSLYRGAHAILTPSQGAADDLAQFAGIDPARVTAVPSPVIRPDLKEKSEQQPDHPWLPSDSPIILGIGELSPRKDFATLIRAFAKVRKLRKARLIILGEGKQRDNLELLATELGITNDVSLPGFSDNPYCYLKQASVFVLTSRFEGSPVVLMEAIGVGTPSVACDCPSGPRETLDNGRYGKLCPVGDDSAIAQAIIETLDKPPKSSELQQAAQRYTVEKSADAYLKALGFEMQT